MYAAWKWIRRVDDLDTWLRLDWSPAWVTDSMPVRIHWIDGAALGPVKAFVAEKLFLVWYCWPSDFQIVLPKNQRCSCRAVFFDGCMEIFLTDHGLDSVMSA